MNYKNFCRVATLVHQAKLKTKTGHTEFVDDLPREVLVYEENVSLNDMYSARAVGYRPELTLVCNAGEYNGEETVRYKGVKYSVIRSYYATRGGIRVAKLVLEVKTGGR